MFIPKLSQVGHWMVKDLKIGQFFSLQSTLHFLREHIQGPSNFYPQPLGISTTRGFFSRVNCDGNQRLFLYPLTQAPTVNWTTETQTCSSKFSTLLTYLKQGQSFSTAATDKANDVQRNDDKEMISVTFVDKDGEEKNIKVPVGMSMLEAAHQNDIELEGACEGSLACSTCHVIVMDVEYYNKLEDPADEENDMLDLAFGLTETSRLGCQVIAKPELDGIRLALPAATRNFAVDGYVPKPH